MHIEFKNAPTGFSSRNISGIQIFFDLISILIRYLQSCSVMTLVDVFVNVFNCLNRSTNLHIDMAIVSGRQIRTVRDNIPVGISVPILFKKAPIIGSSIEWIPIITKVSCFTQFFGILFCTPSISHAFGTGLLSTTWTMNHVFSDDLIQNGLSHRIRNLSRNNRINISCISDLIIRVEEDQEVHMGKSSLLKLYGMHHC